MAKVLVLAVAAFLAPHAAESDVANEDSINSVVLETTTPPPGVSASSIKKVKMVVNTLQDILQSVESEEKQDSTLYDKYMAWCESRKSDIANTLADAERDLGNSKVQSQEQESSIDSLKTTVENKEKEIAETQDAMDQATALRQQENEKYTDDMQLNTQSLRQIDSAIKHVGKVQSQGGFLQNGVMKKLQINAPGESSFVLGIMKGLKDKLEKTRASTMKIEGEEVDSYNTLMQTKGQSLKTVQSATTEKKILLTETEAKDSGTQQSMSKLKDEADSASTSEKQTEAMCHQAELEWKDRQDDRTQEKAAIREAVRFLNQTALEQISLAQQRTETVDISIVTPSFLQTASESRDSEGSSDEDAAKEELSNDELARHMRKDTFDGVKGIVKKLIVSHEDKQDEQTQKKDYCKKELDSTQDAKAETSAALDTTKASIDSKQAEADLLDNEVKQLYSSQEEGRKSVEDASKVRKQEEAAYQAASKDRSIAIKVLMQAKTVLQAFYDEAKSALLQKREDPPEKWQSTRKTAASYGAVSMIQNIADDIAKEQKDATIREKRAIRDYEKLQQDTQAENDQKQQDITDRVTTRAKLKVQINTLKESKIEETDTLTSLTSQLESLHNQCDELLKNYEDKEKGRDFEVSQLRDVLDVLSGSSIAPRTGALLQESAAQAKQENAEEDGGTSDEEADERDQQKTPKETTAGDEGSVSEHEAALLRSLSP